MKVNAKITQSLPDIKTTFCDLKGHFMKKLRLHRVYYQNWLINECGRKNLAKRARLM